MFKLKFAFAGLLAAALLTGCLKTEQKEDLSITSGSTLSGAGASRPTVAVDAGGNGWGVWAQGARIYASRYLASSPATNKWQTPVAIDLGGGFAEEPEIGVDSSGNYIAVWSQADATGLRSIWANRYDAASGLWGTAQQIESGTGAAYSVALAVNDSGQAVAVWIQYGCGSSALDTRCAWANRYVPGSGWGTEEAIDTETTMSSTLPVDHAGDKRDVYFVAVAMNAAGVAQVVWEKSSEDGEIRHDIWARRFNFGAGPSGSWDSAATIEKSNDMAHTPRVVIDAIGNATATWRQGLHAGTDRFVFGNRYATGSGWLADRVQLEAIPGQALVSDLAVDSGGNVTSVWFKGNKIYASSVAAGALPATPVDTSTAKVVFQSSRGMSLAGNPLSLVTDALGNVTAVFNDADGDILANQAASGVWGASFRIESSLGFARDPVAAQNGGGTLLVVWAQQTGTADSVVGCRLSGSTCPQ